MSIFEAIVQGIVQGATEFLPVSSSGHLSLAQHIMGVKVDSLLFDILLHLLMDISPQTEIFIYGKEPKTLKIFSASYNYNS